MELQKNNILNEISTSDFLHTIDEAQECLRVANILKGHYEIIKNEKEDIVKKVTEAKKFVASKPDVLNFLQKLQTALHQKNIGIFNQLLTYFLQDVLKTDKEINVDLYPYRGMPALKVSLNNNGNLEDVYSGNGGSVSNIVSAGLRLIALSRLNHRKFIVLDEPDCWLEPENVPLFAKTICEIAYKLKIQTVMVSHHSWKYFKDYARVIELRKEGSILVTEIIHDSNLPIDEKINYIKKVRLQNVMSHSDTIYELSPYLNCIVGKNNIGKSVFSIAQKAINYNISDDDIISHNVSVAKILNELSDGTQILWERIRKTNNEFPQKVRYTLYKNGIYVTQEYNSDSVPSFISKELNVLLTEDIDIHINNQKEPVFLLGDSVKPQDKAKILSLGKESLLIQKMMEILKSKTRINNAVITSGEEKYIAYENQMSVLEGVEDLIIQVEAEKNKLSSHLDTLKNKEYLISLLSQIKALNDINKLGQVDYTDVNLERKDVEALTRVVKGVKAIAQVAFIKPCEVFNEPIEYKNTDVLNSDIDKLKVLVKMLNIEKVEVEQFETINLDYKRTNYLQTEINGLKGLVQMIKVEKIDVPDLEMNPKRSSEHLLGDIKTLKSNVEILNNLYALAEKGKQMKKQVDEDIKKFLEENKNICDKCGQPLNMSHFGGEHD